ncbi:hypothetical protein [Palleronia sp. LCG004]|uniref:hypothetical protein n=1 Tax=Palleronia sp. LCG004 TaxID=3079304 RepID=UPI002942BCD4|nr:hypothetical protein [Palleronia sp. LCG004]WOI56960.1 hypothetical protein RVY76_03950 [Palleronia sp. LCG004]
MKNPMLAKNPFMSAWLSAANQIAAPARGQMMAEMRRNQMQMMQDWQQTCMKIWFPWMHRGR